MESKTLRVLYQSKFHSQYKRISLILSSYIAGALFSHMKMAPMQLLRVSDYQTMAWKNGQGQTQQISIYPFSAKFLNNDFDWRLSWASLETSGSFSLFPGYQRKLVFWQGSAVQLNQLPLELFSPIEFSGEDHIDYRLGEGGAQDLGIIYRPEKVKVSVQIYRAKTELNLNIQHQTFLFCASGRIGSADWALGPCECLVLTEPQKLQLSAAEAVLIAVEIIYVS